MTTVSLTRREPVRFNHVIVIGGGCYGSWYTQQLARAFGQGALEVERVTVVDRDANCLVAERHEREAYGDLPVSLAVTEWNDWMQSWLNDVPPETLAGDALVPSPLMPHLLLDWLMARAASRWPSRTVSVEPLRRPPDIPWQRAAPDARHYVSFAEWMCPVNCIEPERCPATRGPRDWSMPPAVQRYVEEERSLGHTLDGPIIFHCLHRVWGVGMIDAEAIARADRTVARAGDAPVARVLVGTVSHCHGALGVLSVA